MAMFPFDVWGNVRASAAGGEVKIKVVQSPGGGYLFLTKENGTEYDTWIETLEEVEADLHALDVEWPSSPSESDDTSGGRSDQTPRR